GPRDRPRAQLRRGLPGVGPGDAGRPGDPARRPHAEAAGPVLLARAIRMSRFAAGAPTSETRPVPPAEPGGLPSLGRGLLALTLIRHLLLAAGAAVLLVLLSYGVSAYVDYNLAGVAVFVIAAAGLDLLTGLSGQLSLGQGAMM